jgi:hypothetical protein
MGNTSCCENKACYKIDLYDRDVRSYRRTEKELEKQWFVLSKMDFHVVYDEDVAKAMVYG